MRAVDLIVSHNDRDSCSKSECAEPHVGLARLLETNARDSHKLYKTFSTQAMAGDQFAAAHKALSLPELVEPILLNAPLRTILLARRVCCTWNRIFTNSWDIQRALFLTTTELGYYSDPDEDVEAVAAKTEDVETEASTTDHTEVRENVPQSGLDRRPILNPFLFL